MAKELPYFKFEPSEWENGNIQLCSNGARGLFIELCCSYWIRLGDLPYQFALMKHCNDDDKLLKELEKNKIIKVKRGLIIIDFLDDQFIEFKGKSLKAKESADKRWKKKRIANAYDPQCENYAIREEEIKVDKIRKDNIEDRKREFIYELTPFVKEYGTDMINKFFSHWSEMNKGGRKMRFEKEKTWDLKRRLQKWKSNDETNFGRNKSEKSKSSRHQDEAKELKSEG